MQRSQLPSLLSGLLAYLLTSFDTLTSQLYQNRMIIRLRDALLVGSLTDHAVAQSKCTQSSSPVDLTWHPPNATNINNLGYVVNGSGINGFIFNSSITPASASYSTYNWCNMPHVRAKEYPRAPQEYTLEYVEVVGGRHFLFCLVLTLSRFIDITSGLHMRITPSHVNHMFGTATTRHCSTTAFLDRMAPPPRRIGRSLLRLPIHWRPRDSTAHASFLRLLARG